MKLKELLAHMPHFKATIESLSCFGVFPNLLDGVLGGHYEAFVVWSHGATLCLRNEGIPVRPNLKVVPENSVLFTDILEDDRLLVLIAIPPFVAQLPVGVWPGLIRGS